MLNPKLSILICHLCNVERADSLRILLSCLERQKTSDVEILVESDHGEMSIGKKRNKLISLAKGEYVCFIDDDDLVAHDYIPKILAALQSNPDCVGIEGFMTQDGKDIGKFCHSIEYAGWYTGADAFYRTPNHLNPIRRTFYDKVKFEEINFGEDHRWSNAIKQYLKTEVYIEGVIYYYQSRSK